jgi:thiamine biosynthesis lipoprotein
MRLVLPLPKGPSASGGKVRALLSGPAADTHVDAVYAATVLPRCERSSCSARASVTLIRLLKASRERTMKRTLMHDSNSSLSDAGSRPTGTSGKLATTAAFRVVLALVCSFFLSCSPSAREPDIHSRTETIMGTFVEIKAVVGIRSAQEIDTAMAAAFGAVRRVDSLMSTYKEDSEVSEINRRAAGEAVRISPETCEVIDKALELSRASDGSFDITVMPLLELWGFAKAYEKTLPSQAEIDRTLACVSYELIDLDPANCEIRLKREGVKIDLGGIAKGYAVDSAVKNLAANGVDAALVNAGGDLYCLGDKAPGTPWRIAVRDPVNEDGVLGYVELTDKAVATSGDYQNYFMADGVRYSHILDPRTGRPSTSGPHSVTVLAETCADADGLATAVFALGPNKGIDLLEKLAGVEGLIVSGGEGNLDITSTSGWDEATSWKRVENQGAR